MRVALRFAVVLLNVAALAWFAWMLLKEGLPRGGDAGLVLLIGATALASLVYGLADNAPSRIRLPEMLRLELEARKATLRRRIADAEQPSGRQHHE